MVEPTVGIVHSMMKRVDASDPVAMCQLGTKRLQEGDYKAAFKHYTKAADLGDAFAHYQLSTLYRDGKGVEKDEKKMFHHADQAAIAGHPDARYNLGCVEWENGQYDRAAKHFIITAKHGDDLSLEQIKRLFKAGYVSEEDFSAALLGYQAAIEAMKSPQREEAAEFARQAADRERRGLTPI